jgi:hypothetical protein
MKRKSSPYRSGKTHAYSEQQLAGLRTSTLARKQETVERLCTAIESLKAKKLPISTQSIYEECGLHYTSYARNPEALAIFQENSTHLAQQRKQVKRREKSSEAASPILTRDPFLNYKKPQLVTRLRDAQQRIQELEQQHVNLVEACLERDARLTELEAKLAELEPYRDFVEQVRMRVRKEEYGGETLS